MYDIVDTNIYPGSSIEGRDLFGEEWGGVEGDRRGRGDVGKKAVMVFSGASGDGTCTGGGEMVSTDGVATT